MPNKTGNGHSINLEKFLEDIKTVVQDGEQILKAGAGEIKNKTVAGAKSTDRLIRSHPYQTIGIMLGLGVLVGLIATAAFGGSETEDDED